ncbi:hypothetical protein DTO166G4_4628 [Paecilomyces variotii]|nr:hypothetical protein DTO166G4_4628 [Paecilomyces variotii]KAJ9225127.1 hypothetical protein DTO169C6_2468 [Paecilomyces variotii]KAJ9235484.1 hypothetical protein DTO166G5_4506 [Paecilomyces variotii]KAJ9247578.1 hypothetical protein DTO195F2_9091 [Paecilomyces variotii]KAJ9261985.1 hypothetical protein DTO212C5_8062 [Paecilomyces variotii]
MADYRLPPHQIPSRKPLPGRNTGFPFQSFDGNAQQQLAALPGASSYAHNRTRTSSSSVLPQMAPQQTGYTATPPIITNPAHYPPSRRLSSATTSTSSTGNGPSADVRRSSSSRSGNSQMGYVALMRRQKATVWCDRSQPEDPRLLAQRRADKKRAYLEVHRSAGAGRTGTLGSGKIKHHGGKGATDFSPSTFVAATVPVRLSANEVGDADEEARNHELPYHRRTGSGRSSLGSNTRYPSGYQRPTSSRYGSTSTPPNGSADIPEVETPEDKAQEKNEYFAEDGNKESDPEDSFGSVGDMAAPSAAAAAARKTSTADELRRRGSVDDRTSTMTGVRLFVANPDND